MEPLDAHQQPSDYPLYNIGVVSRMTGISIASLRAWERRYGFPESGRTTGGHRLYSERDVMRLRWVKNQVDGGLQTAQAIQALQRREGEAGSAESTWLMVDVAGADNPPEGLEGYARRMIAALVEHDTVRCDALLGEVMLDHPLSDVIFEVVVPALAEMGDLWERGRITVATEHFATSYMRHRLMMWMLGGPTPFPVRPVVLACAPNELHEGSLLIIGALLRRQRWPVAYLGAAVPLADLAAFVDEVKPPAVVLVAMREETVQGLADWPHFIHTDGHGRPLVSYGGRVFVEQPEWRDRVPGMYLGDTIQEGIDRLDDLLQARRPG